MRTTLRATLVGGLVALLTAAPTGGASALGRNATISLDMAGGGADRASHAPSVSARTGYVAFVSAASDLVAGDTNGKADVFVRNTNSRETVRASVDAAGGDANGDSLDPAMSGDGHFVAFTSYASDLVLDDTNGMPDVFVRDLWTGTTVRASVDTLGDDANGPSGEPSISGSGEFLAFSSDASDLVAGDGNGATDVFVRTMTTRTTLRASVDSNGGDPNGASHSPSIAGMGRRVAFASDASDLVTGDENGTTDVYVRWFLVDTTVRASVDLAGGDPDGASDDPSFDAGGQYVAFASTASDLVSGDQNGRTDVFVRDTKGLITTRASVDSGGGDANGDSLNPAISLSGRNVVFESVASDLVPGDGNGVSDIFLRDLQATAPILVSVDMNGGSTNGPSHDPSASDSPLMVFVSEGTDLTRQDVNGFEDVFLTQTPG
jgi:Tol biopolymer transport system component